MNSEVNFYRFVGDIIAEAILGEQEEPFDAAKFFKGRLRDQEFLKNWKAKSEKEDFNSILTRSTPRGSDARNSAAEHGRRLLATRRARRERAARELKP